MALRRWRRHGLHAKPGSVGRLGLARQFVRLVHDNPIQDATLRKHASDSARSTAVHTAEGAASWSKADKSRVYVMARAECCEAVAC